MSSILDALKKAERESSVERAGKIPGPARLPKRSPYPPRRRRWWLPLGLLAVVCLGAVLFWQFRPAGVPQPAPASAPPPATQARTSSPPPMPRQEPIRLSARKEQAASAAPAADQKPPQRPEHRSAPALQAKAPATSPVKPVVPPTEKRIDRTLLTALPEKAPPASEERVSQVTAAPIDSAADPADEIQGQPQEEVAVIPTAPPPAEESRKTYRSDPRIELQALVWAPEASARFVVINNRLLKEGGSTDGITVVQINRDDVLLAEGADRWHEKFKIR